MAAQDANNPTALATPPAPAGTAGALALALAPATPETLALRVPPRGLVTLLLKTDGTLAYHDASAGAFFQRFVLPMLQQRDSVIDEAMLTRLRAVSAGSGVTVWDFLPGVTLAAFPCVEKRQLVGIMVVAAKGPHFSLGEDVVRVCSRLGIDGIWLQQQADELPSYADEAIQRQARLMLSMVRDQVRLAGMEKELDSLSGQLSNTYEELSLIYQLSSGMKVNRRPGDFFKQACLDVMEVMSVRGMGFALRGEQFQDYGPLLYGAFSLPPGEVQRLSDDLLVALDERKSAILIHHLEKDKRFAWLGQYAQQLIAVPLMRQDQVLGCLFALDKL